MLEQPISIMLQQWRNRIGVLVWRLDSGNSRGGKAVWYDASINTWIKGTRGYIAPHKVLQVQPTFGLELCVKLKKLNQVLIWYGSVSSQSPPRTDFLFMINFSSTSLTLVLRIYNILCLTKLWHNNSYSGRMMGTIIHIVEGWRETINSFA